MLKMRHARCARKRSTLRSGHAPCVSVAIRCVCGASFSSLRIASAVICQAARLYVTIRRLVTNAPHAFAGAGISSWRTQPKKIFLVGARTVGQSMTGRRLHSRPSSRHSECIRRNLQPLPSGLTSARVPYPRCAACEPMLWLRRLEGATKDAQRKKPERKLSLPTVKQRRDLAARHLSYHHHPKQIFTQLRLGEKPLIPLCRVVLSPLLFHVHICQPGLGACRA